MTRLINFVCWSLGLLTYVAGGEQGCEHADCPKPALWHDHALDLRLCDTHTGGAT